MAATKRQEKGGTAWREEFANEWNSSRTIDEFINNYPHFTTNASASVMAARLRAGGYDLKIMSRGRLDRYRVAASLHLNNSVSLRDISFLMNESVQAVESGIRRVE